MPARRRAHTRTMELKLKYLSLPILVFSISISGCAITVSELKSSHSSYDGSFTSEKTPSDTYRNLRLMARQCLEHETYTGKPVIVLSEFSDERSEGEINQKLLSEGLLINNALIEIERHDANKAQVRLYTTKSILSVGARSPKISDIKRWADGDINCANEL
jgi:hypothetical protein